MRDTTRNIMCNIFLNRMREIMRDIMRERMRQILRDTFCKQMCKRMCKRMRRGNVPREMLGICAWICGQQRFGLRVHGGGRVRGVGCLLRLFWRRGIRCVRFPIPHGQLYCSRNGLFLEICDAPASAYDVRSCFCVVFLGRKDKHPGCFFRVSSLQTSLGTAAALGDLLLVDVA